MMETAKQRTQALNIAGEILTFPTFTMRAFPSFNVMQMYNDAQTVFDPDTREYAFETSATLAKQNNVAEGNTFTFTDGYLLYNFRVLEVRPNLQGWVMIPASLESFDNV